MTDPVRLAFLTTHPVQYAAPLFRRIAADPDIDLTVFYASDLTVREFADPGFGRRIAWDVPLLDGYRSDFLEAWGGTGQLDLLRPFSRGLARRLKEGRFDCLAIHGYSRPVHWLAALTARRLGIRVLFRDEATPISRRRGPVRRALKRVFFAAIDRLADGWLTIGSLNAAYYRQQGVAEEKLFACPYAVDNAFFRNAAPDEGLRLRHAIGIPDDAPVILYASKLQRRKHADHLLAAFRQLAPAPAGQPPPHLVFAGDGELMPDLRAMAEGMDSVHFLGFQGQRNLIACYAMCDVFVLPSSCEPWGLVVNEAMNLGKAIIVSDQVGCGPDLVRHGENGFVVPVGDIGAMGKALAALCADRDLAASMGRRSLEIVSGLDFEADLRGIRQALGLPPRRITATPL